MPPSHTAHTTLTGASKAVFLFIFAALSLLSFSCTTSPSVKTDPDAPYLPTPDHALMEMLRIADVTGQDRLYDLGCGDGRVVVAAARHFGTRSTGVEIDPALVAQGMRSAREAGVSEKVTFLCADLFTVDLKEATVVTLYLLPGINVMLRPRLLSVLEPGSRVVSHMHDMGEWRPDRTSRSGDSTLYLWIIPADVDGAWDITIGADASLVHARLSLRQTFQDLTGVLDAWGKKRRITGGRLHGREVEFSADRIGPGKQKGYFTGTVRGNKIEGEVTLAAAGTMQTYPWTAYRKTPG